MATIDSLDEKVDLLLQHRARSEVRLDNIKETLDRHIAHHIAKTDAFDRRLRRVEVAVLGALLSVPSSIFAVLRVLG